MFPVYTRKQAERRFSMDNLKILVVDDEERMRKLIKDFLKVKGFSVVEAADGEVRLYDREPGTCVDPGTG